MCTVTFIPVKNKFFITSNRDEKVFRRQAFPSDINIVDGRKMIFPKDADAGGSWIALHENGNAGVLLNGAFEYHLSKPPYEKSRGLVFLDIIKSSLPVIRFLRMDLGRIEPFTLILFENTLLYECRWDGKKKHFTQLNNNKPHIWSSATLYDKETVRKRESWFQKFLSQNPDPSQSDIFFFHQNYGDGDKQNDLLMDRTGRHATVSVTGIELNDEKGNMLYLDLGNGKTYFTEMDFISFYELA